MKLGIKTKLTLLTTAIAVVAGAVVGYVGYQVTAKELINGEARALQTTRQTLAAYLESLVGNYKTNLGNQASSPAVSDALTTFNAAFTAFPSEVQAAVAPSIATAQRANDKADAVEVELDARPTLEVRAAASGSAGRPGPGAVVIVHPPKGRGIPVPTASSVEVPATLPDGGLP